MLAAGSDIIDNVSWLENNFFPLLRRSAPPGVDDRGHRLPAIVPSPYLGG
jgi:hypothetical protein